MTAFEFSARIEHGSIKLPEEYGDTYENSYARIIVLTDEKDESLTNKNKMRLALQKMQKLKMFQNIENPLNWKKRLRDEWE